MATKGTKTGGERFRRIRHSAIGQADGSSPNSQAAGAQATGAQAAGAQAAGAQATSAQATGPRLTGAAGSKGVYPDPQAPREHFIPVRREDLLRALTADLTTNDSDREQLQHICQLLEDSFHFLHYRRFRTLLSDYSPFDPDADTPSLTMDNEAERTRRATSLCDKLASLLRQANFRRLERDDIALALEAASDWGLRLKVRFEDFEQLEVYARGEGVLERERRTWRSLFRPRTVEVPVFQRLAIVFRRKAGTEPDLGALEVDEGSVHIKLFKNIPKYDIEMLLPGVQVRMSWLDRGRILLPTVSGLALTGYKLIKGALVIAAVSLYGILALLGLIGGTLGYGLKSLMGYLRTKDKYHLQLTRNLYYRNLDNNAGALFRLVAEAEEQELREVLLSYFLLWRDAGSEGWTSRQLDEASEEFLTRLLGTEVDFEVGDAIRKLEQLRLVDPRPGHRWRAISLDEAYRRLREKWQAYRTEAP